MSYKSQVQRSLDTSPGFLIKTPDTPHRTVLPNWNHETQIRPFPAPHPDGGFQCIRAGSDDNNFGDAVWSEPVVQRLGVKEQFTYIDRILGITGKTPTSRFIESISTLIKEKPREVPESWMGWKDGGTGRAPKLQKSKSHIFFQGMEVMRKGKLLVNEAGQMQPMFPMVFMGSVSLQMSFEEMGNTRVADFPGPMPEAIAGDTAEARAQRDALYGKMFALGDWCSISHGRIISIFKAEAAGRFTMNHYAIKPMQELPLDAIAEQVRALWVPWDKLLRYFTVEEHVQMLCRAFPPEAVDYVFGSTELRDLMPDAFKDAWKRYRAADSNMAPGVQYQAPAPQAPVPQQPDAALQAGVARPQAAPTQPAFTAPAPQAPAPQAPAPQAPAPQAPATPAGGLAVNFSGSPVGSAPDAPQEAIMQSDGFASPPEFNAAAGAPAPMPPAAAAVNLTPQAPAAQAPASTPAGAAPAVDNDELQKQLNALKASRDQSAEGNS